MKKIIVLMVVIGLLLVTGTANITAKAYNGAYKYCDELNGKKIAYKDHKVYETIVEVEGKGFILPTFEYGEYIIDDQGMIQRIRSFELNTFEALAKGI